MLTWMLVCLLGLSLLRFLTRRVWVGKITGPLLTGLVLLNIPVLWTQHIFLPEALCRLAGTAVLAGLLWLLLPVPVRGRARLAVYAALVIAGLYQTMLAAWQVLLPASAARFLGYDFLRYGGRAIGVFGQANLLGSFLATALLSALWLMQSTRSFLGRALAGAAAILIVTGLVFSESRSAMLGAAVGSCLLLCCAPASRLQMASVLAVGVIFASLTAAFRPVMVIPANSSTASASVTVGERLESDRAASGRERLALTEGTLSLIASRPLAGSGIGSFETAFPMSLARSGRVNPFPVTVEHPHNELLYAWSEGGALALFGLLCWLALWFRPFYTLPALMRRHKSARHVIARGTLTVPLMVHVMTEFPFYLSAAHGVLMVVLMWLAMPAAARRGRPARNSWPVQTMVGCACVGGLVFMATALQSAFCIRYAEHTLLQDEMPLTRVSNRFAQSERLQFDLAVANLVRFSRTRDETFLYRFQQQAGAWLTVHNDAYLTDAMMRISRAQQDKMQAEYWRQRGCMSYNTDPRFRCGSLFPEALNQYDYK